MKRSQINQIIKEGDAFIRGQGFHLPAFAYWTPEDWERKGEEVREIVENGLGWDVTDFGLGEYEAYGLFLFTLRNGNPKNWERMEGKLYAEKIMVVGVNQVTPLHFHARKMEDIINRGGGKLAIQLFNATETDELDDSEIQVKLDGVDHRIKAGETLLLKPGDSITFPPRLYHKFWGVEKQVLVGEVSIVNDDQTDNYFYDQVGRFPKIEEDESPLHLLVGDYDRFYLAN